MLPEKTIFKNLFGKSGTKDVKSCHMTAQRGEEMKTGKALIMSSAAFSVWVVSIHTIRDIYLTEMSSLKPICKDESSFHNVIWIKLKLNSMIEL